MSNIRKKVLLMGKSGSGKTSMRSVIFSNMLAQGTKTLGATIDVEHSHVRFLGNMVLNLWDCGGQEAFLDHYVSTQKDQIFSNVAILIYVFDATTTSSSSEWEKDVQYFEDCIEALRGNETSSGAGVWVLVNKMDLVGQGPEGSKEREEGRRRILKEKKDELELRAREIAVRLEGRDIRPIRVYGTSIWDESLYKAWSSVIHTLIPNASLIRSHLTHLRNISSSIEAVLFERQTFLVLAKSGSEIDADEDELDGVEVRGGVKGLDRKRFEKVSEIIKGFRLDCLKSGEAFANWEARFKNASMAMDVLTANTCLMLIASEPWVEPALLMYNIREARKHFEELQGTSVSTPCLICKEHPECRYEVREGDGGTEWGHG